jgi:hypothetical protein
MKKASGKRPTKPAPKPAAVRAGGRKRAVPAVPAGRDDIAPEYDFRSARPNPYAARYAAGATAVVLDPDVAAAFPSAERVNEVLRAVAGILQPPPPTKERRSRRSA